MQQNKFTLLTHGIAVTFSIMLRLDKVNGHDCHQCVGA